MRQQITTTATRTTVARCGVTAALPCCLLALCWAAAPRACRAQSTESGYGLSAALNGVGSAPLDVTGALTPAAARPLGLSALSSAAGAYDPLDDMGFRGGRRVDWSRLPATRLLRGLIRAAAADRTRMGIRSNFYRADEGRFTAGLIYRRGTGGVGANWSF
jgi:hypothetical protein